MVLPSPGRSAEDAFSPPQDHEALLALAGLDEHEHEPNDREHGMADHETARYQRTLPLIFQVEHNATKCGDHQESQANLCEDRNAHRHRRIEQKRDARGGEKAMQHRQPTWWILIF